MALVRQRRQLPHLTLPLDHFALRPPPAPPAAVAPSTSSDAPRLADYEKISLLGQGNGGTVYKARHRRTSQPFALKLFAAEEPSAAREAEILMLAADVPHVVRLHAVIPSPAAEQPAALALELVRGGSLAGLLRRLGRSMAERPIAAVARQALLGLNALHALRVVHRDLKPANILVGAAGEIKIADFGAGKVLRRRLDPCASYVGTAAYMSPERFDPETYSGDYDPYAADVWSLGLAILELYMGHFPLLPAGQRPDWAALMCAICFGERSSGTSWRGASRRTPGGARPSPSCSSTRSSPSGTQRRRSAPSPRSSRRRRRSATNSQTARRLIRSKYIQKLMCT